jgi:hypothetical protein
MDNTEFKSVEHRKLEMDINKALEAQDFNLAIKLIQDNVTLYNFEATISDTPYSQKRNS